METYTISSLRCNNKTTTENFIKIAIFTIAMRQTNQNGKGKRQAELRGTLESPVYSGKTKTWRDEIVSISYVGNESKSYKVVV
jgi:hypothetical protein